MAKTHLTCHENSQLPMSQQAEDESDGSPLGQGKNNVTETHWWKLREHLSKSKSRVDEVISNVKKVKLKKTQRLQFRISFKMYWKDSGV